MSRTVSRSVVNAAAVAELRKLLCGAYSVALSLSCPGRTALQQITSTRPDVKYARVEVNGMRIIRLFVEKK